MTDKIKITDLNKVHEVEVRKSTNKLIEMIDDDLIDPYEVAIMCLKWMSEDDVARMCEENDVFWILEEDEEEVEDEEDDRSELPWDYGKHFD